MLLCFCFAAFFTFFDFSFFINTGNVGFSKESQCFEVLKWQFSVAVESDAETLCKASRGWEPDSFAEVNGWHVEKYYIFFIYSRITFAFFFFGAFELARFEHSYLLLVPRPHSTGHLMCEEFVFGFVPSKGLRPCCTCWLAFRNGHTRDAKYCNLFLGHDLYIVCVVLFFFTLMT
uniref:Secreted protein n=1 Tax=Ixodes scapularis TaxID=6945 RepID=A0A4D5RCA7_IXOSC